MSIDEAIAHEKEVAKEIYVEAMLCHANPDDDKLDDCIENGKYHEQIAEWLEELKKLRQCTNIENREYPYFNGFKEGKQVGYNKAIDDLSNKICIHFADWQYSEEDKCIKDIIELAYESVEEIAEQLKEGGNDDD